MRNVSSLETFAFYKNDVFGEQFLNEKKLFGELFGGEILWRKLLRMKIFWRELRGRTLLQANFSRR